MRPSSKRRKRSSNSRVTASVPERRASPIQCNRSGKGKVENVPDRGICLKVYTSLASPGGPATRRRRALVTSQAATQTATSSSATCSKRCTIRRTQSIWTPKRQPMRIQAVPESRRGQAVVEEKTPIGHLHRPGGEEEQRAGAGGKAPEHHRLGAVLFEVTLDALETRWGQSVAQEAMLGDGRPKVPAQPEQARVAGEDGEQTGRDRPAQRLLTVPDQIPRGQEAQIFGQGYAQASGEQREKHPGERAVATPHPLKDGSRVDDCQTCQRRFGPASHSRRASTGQRRHYSSSSFSPRSSRSRVRYRVRRSMPRISAARFLLPPVSLRISSM